MSLKEFHAIFIIASIVLCLVTAIWAFYQFTLVSTTQHMIASIASVLSAAGLIVYEIRFLKKAKTIS